MNTGIKTSQDSEILRSIVEDNGETILACGQPPDEIINKVQMSLENFDAAKLFDGEKDANGDNIYNGALDNASGVASILAIAEAITKIPKKEQPKRSQIFLFTVVSIHRIGC